MPDSLDAPGLAPTFEAFALWTRTPASPDEVADLIAPVLGDGWNVTPIADDPTGFEIDRAGQPLSEATAWDATYDLRALPEVRDVEPLFEVAVFEDPTSSPRPWLEAAEGDAPHLPGSGDPFWGLDLVNARTAIHEFFGGDPGRAGAGVVIGHPDTGYHHHPEIVGNLLIDRGYDFVNDDSDAIDDLVSPPKVILKNPSHGVGTSSVIISPPGVQPVGSSATGVEGVAPGAKLIPIRCTRTVVLVSMLNLARAIEFAVDQGAHVISMSLGGVPSKRLYRAIRFAESKGVVVCAAAGNQVRFVVWPANYVEVIACAACNADRKPWKESSRGRAVDVTAPGESVWRARVERNGQTGEVSNHVSQGSGTSYAVAHVAGAAALWLARHDRDALLARYGPAKLPSVFRALVAQSCAKVPTLGSKYGAGLLDILALLRLPLPAAGGLESTAGGLEAAAFGPTPVAELDQLFNAGPKAPLEAASADRPSVPALHQTLATLLKTPTAELGDVLDEVGDELVFHLLTRPDDFDRLREAAKRPPNALESVAPEVVAVRADLRQSERSSRLHAIVS